MNSISDLRHTNLGLNFFHRSCKIFTPLSLSLSLRSFHEEKKRKIVKEKEGETKEEKGRKELENAREANENVNQISHLCYLPPPPFHLPLLPPPPPLIFPLLPDTRPSSPFFSSSTTHPSLLLLLSFTCTYTTTTIAPRPPQFPIVYSRAQTHESHIARHGSIVRARTSSSPSPPSRSDYIETTSVQNRYCAGTPTLPDDLLQNSTNLRIPKLFRLSCFSPFSSPFPSPCTRNPALQGYTRGLKNNFRDVTEFHHRKDFPFFFHY